MSIMMIYIALFLLTSPNYMMIFDFEPGVDLKNWSVVDDVVMGGRSNGSFNLSEKGHGLFSGLVSLENNGGFSSVRYRFDQKDVSPYTNVVLRLKGDGKRFQFRVKSDQSERHSYIKYFETSGEWQTIEIPLTELYPTFRGMTLRIPNFPGLVMEEIAFLIANNEAESFRLEIDWISLN